MPKPNQIHKYTQKQSSLTPTDGQTIENSKVECSMRLKLLRMAEEIANNCDKGREEDRGNRTPGKEKNSGNEHYEEEREVQDAG